MKVIPSPQWKDTGTYKEPVDSDNIRVPRLEIDDATTYLDKDESGNLYFVDAVTGTKTLAQLGDLATIFSSDLPEGTLIRFDSIPSADGKYSGIGFTGVAGTTVVLGDVVYLASGTSRWVLAKGDAEATVKPEVAMVITGGGDGDTVFLSQDVHIREDDWTWSTVGAPLFISPDTAGDMDESAPTTGEYAKVVAHVKTSASIHFRPDNVWVKVG